MNETLQSQFQLIRSRIEAERKPHEIVMVTSAQPDDGARFIAFGVAETLAGAGHAVALVDAVSTDADADDGQCTTDVASAFPIYALPRKSASRAREAFETFARDMRSAFDFTIVAAPPVGREGPTVMLAGTIDAILLTLRTGRQPSDKDKLMMRTLRAGSTPMMGVVAVDPASILQFENLAAARNETETHRVVAPPGGSAKFDAVARIRQAR